MSWRRASLIACVGLLAAIVAPASASAASGPPARLAPQAGVLFGSWVNLTWPTVRPFAVREAQVQEVESIIGRRLAINHHYYQWTREFPTDLERWDVERGRIPLVSWAGDRGFANVDEILAGSWDWMIRQRGRAMRDFGHEIFLRYGWEMNGAWSGYGGLANKYEWPAKFVAAWRRIHGLFQAEGATNVVWVWSPWWRSSPGEEWNHWSNYYPGDSYVDWVGIDGYSDGARSLATIVSPLYNAYAARKPIMIGETGTTGDDTTKGAWIASAHRALKTRFPRVRAIVYFNEAPGIDWDIDGPKAWAAYTAMGRDRYFNPTIGTHGTVSSARPAPFSTLVRPAVSVAATAKNTLDCSTVSPVTVTISPAVATAPACAGRSLQLDNASLRPATEYTVVVGPGVRDSLGQPVSAIWTFRTAPAVNPISAPRARRVGPRLWRVALAVRLIDVRTVRVSVRGPRGPRRWLVRPPRKARLAGPRRTKSVRLQYASDGRRTIKVFRSKFKPGYVYRLEIRTRVAGSARKFTFPFRT